MANRRAVILRGHVDAGAPPDELDVLAQAAAIAEALRGFGWETSELALTLDLASARSALQELAPAFVFNLVESLEGRGCYIHLAPLLLEELGIPFTGSGQQAMFLTSGKTAAKRFLDAAGIRTPPWMDASEVLAAAPSFAPPWIVKNGWEHASIGLEDSSVCEAADRLRATVTRRARREGLPNLYVERFIDGREFNLALLGRPHGGEPESLPPAEIEFVDYPEGKPRMVGYRAKWHESSREFRRTPRRFGFGPQDQPLLDALARVSRRCWELFGVRGWARVDFRVDPDGVPWVLEINANPCVAPDSGFAAAAARAGMPFRDVVARIVADVLGKESP
jgi:D-alanine-D-alanine ligase